MAKDLSKHGLLPVGENPVQAYFSDRLQIADILEWLLEQTGPATVLVSTFSTSEEFLRRFCRMKQQGLVKDSLLLCDQRALSKTRHLTLFMAQAFGSVRVCSNHSKVVLVKNDQWKVAVVTSQNQTRGDRFEAGVVISDQRVFSALMLGADDLMSNSVALEGNDR